MGQQWARGNLSSDGPSEHNVSLWMSKLVFRCWMGPHDGPGVRGQTTRRTRSSVRPANAVLVGRCDEPVNLLLPDERLRLPDSATPTAPSRVGRPLSAQGRPAPSQCLPKPSVDMTTIGPGVPGLQAGHPVDRMVRGNRAVSSKKGRLTLPEDLAA